MSYSSTKLVDEKNLLLGQRKLARARCAECTTRKQSAPPNDMVAVAALLKSKNLILDEEMLARIANSDNVEGDGFTTVTKEKAARPTSGPEIPATGWIVPGWSRHRWWPVASRAPATAT